MLDWDRYLLWKGSYYVYKYLFKYKGLCIAALAFICIYSILNTFIALAMKLIIDVIFDINGLNMIFKVLLFIVGLLLSIAVVSVVRTALVSKLNKNVIKSIRQDIFEKVINMDIVEFQKNYSSDFISILNNDVTIVEENYFAPIYERNHCVNDCSIFYHAYETR